MSSDRWAEAAVQERALRGLGAATAAGLYVWVWV